MKPFRSILSLAFALSVISQAHATTFIVPSDRELVQSAGAIVIGSAQHSISRRGAGGEIETVTTVTIEQTLKGSFPSGSVDIVELGGVVGTSAMIIPATPTYRNGERALILLDQLPDGSWRTHDMILGKFTFTSDSRGQRLLLRGVGAGDEIFGWNEEGEAHFEPIRLERAFLQFVRSVIRDEEANEGYFAASQETFSSDASVIAPLTANEYLQNASVGGVTHGFRWNVFDTGGSITYRTNGAHAGFDSLGAVDRASNAWNGHSTSPVDIRRSGTSSLGDSENGENTVVFNTPLSGGAIGLCKIYGDAIYVRNGENFIRLSESDVLIKGGLSISQTAFDELLAHEIGHGIGFRHSDQPGGSPSSNVSVMKTVLIGSLGANLQAWDNDAINNVYGTGTSCAAPTITTQPLSQTINSGQSANLSVVASGSGNTFQWFQGTSGTTTNPVGGATTVSLNTGALTATTSFWVRVTSSCGSPVNSNTATITVCQPPVITIHPQDRTINEGQSTSLTVDHTGTLPMTYQWFRGSSGDLSNPVSGATSKTLNTSPATTTTFWVRVSNSCGSVNSNAATVTVNPCTSPSITTQPSDVTITSGSTATLSVAASGTGLSFQWFRGTSGDLGSPVGGATSATMTTSALTATASFWVRVTNSCGSANSTTATVTVTASCAPAAIISHPVSVSIASGSTASLTVGATGTGLSFQWFRGSSGDLSSPVAGATSATMTTGPLTSTSSFWVRVSNSCGSPVNSNTAVVTVAAPCVAPVVTSQPLSQSRLRNQTAQLSVVVTGSGPFTFQWFRGSSGDLSSPVSGAVSSSMTTPPLTSTTRFWVRVSNGCGTVHSNAATITILAGRNRPARRR